MSDPFPFASSAVQILLALIMLGSLYFAWKTDRRSREANQPIVEAQPLKTEADDGGQWFRIILTFRNPCLHGWNLERISVPLTSRVRIAAEANVRLHNMTNPPGRPAASFLARSAIDLGIIPARDAYPLAVANTAKGPTGTVHLVLLTYFPRGTSRRLKISVRLSSTSNRYKVSNLKCWI